MITLISDTATLHLPNAELGNAIRPNSTVLLKRAMDSSVTTHVKIKDKPTYRVLVVLPRRKSIEVITFFYDNSTKKLNLLWRSLNISVNLRVNPIELELATRAIYANSVEETSLQLEFEQV